MTVKMTMIIEGRRACWRALCQALLLLPLSSLVVFRLAELIYIYIYILTCVLCIYRERDRERESIHWAWVSLDWCPQESVVVVVVVVVAVVI